MFNPNAKFAKSKGVDLPLLRVYLAGRISGDCIEECLAWRKKIVKHYKEYEWDEEKQEYVSYPIAFLDALNSKEADSVDTKGLKSRIPPNLIFDKDLLSIKHADVVVANMDDFFEVGIEKYLYNQTAEFSDWYKEAYYKLRDVILDRRENLGTIEEVGIAKYIGKPTILIVPQRRKETFENHPFQKRASIIVSSVEELLKEKWLEVLYKSVAGATGDY